MSLLTELPDIIKRSEKKYERAAAGDFRITDIYGNGDNMLAMGDNVSFMKYLSDTAGLNGRIKMIYVDPPFFSGSDHSAKIKIESDIMENIPPIKTAAYDDKWQRGMSFYLEALIVRLLLMRDLMSEDGLIWMHLDWHAVHYAKVIMDEIFGAKNFVNEIIWQYKSGGAGKRHFSRKHDNILVYARSKKYTLRPGVEKSYNREYKPYRFKNVKEYRDETGWYTMVTAKDVWQIDMVGRTSSERTGYATQKPEALLKKMIESCTDEGDICADFFCGCSTLPAVCEKTGRRWIACDSVALAIGISQKRLLRADFSILSEEKETRGRSGRLELEVSTDDGNVSEMKVVSIRPVSYSPPLRSLPVDSDSKELIKAVRKKDPLQLIDFWSVDTDFDGICHRPEACFSKAGRASADGFFRPLPTGRTISVKAVDIFGNVTEKIFSI